MSKNAALQYQCSLCDYKFITKSKLQTHKSSVHWCVKYTCDRCELKYSYIYICRLEARNRL